MEAVVLGPSDVSKVWRHGSVRKEGFRKYIDSMGQALAQCFDGLVIIPDDGVPLEAGKAYTRHSGKKPVGVFPDRDTDNLEPNFRYVEPVHLAGSWADLNYSLTSQGNPVVCLGYSPGVLVEIGFLKYNQKRGVREGSWLKDIHLFVDEMASGGRLPPQMDEELKNVFYFDGPEKLEMLTEKKRRALEG